MSNYHNDRTNFESEVEIINFLVYIDVTLLMQ